MAVANAAIRKTVSGSKSALAELCRHVAEAHGCKAELEMKPDQSGLKCVQCKRVYPIRDDIPVMLIDEAKVEE